MTCTYRRLALTLLNIIFVLAPCFAQLSLGGALIPFVLQKEFIMRVDGSSGLAEGPSGAGVSWDLSAFVNKANALVQYTDPAANSHTSTFPTATVLANDPLNAGDTAFSFIRYDNSVPQLSEVGTYRSSTQKLITYTTPRILQTSGLKNYGDSITNPYKGSGTFDSAGMHATIIRTGTIKRVYDAWGNLKTKWTNAANIARVKTVDHYTDSVTIGGNLRVDVVDETNFVWVISTAPGERLASVSHITRNGVAADEGFYYCVGCTLGISGAGAPKASNQLTVYPQPARDIATIHIASAAVQEVHISMVNVLGQEVYRGTAMLKAGDNLVNVNTSAMESGVYIVRVGNASFALHESLALEH